MIANSRHEPLSRPDHKIIDRTKIRDGKVANRPIYVVMAVTVEGTRDILGIWAGDGGEGAKFWLQIFTELKNRGLDDCLMLVCDGLKGLPDAVETVWPRTIVQTCVIHLLRNSFRYAARQDWDRVAKALKPVYTAPSEAAAAERFLEFSETWGTKYPAVIKLWSDAWDPDAGVRRHLRLAVEYLRDGRDRDARRFGDVRDRDRPGGIAARELPSAGPSAA